MSLAFNRKELLKTNFVLVVDNKPILPVFQIMLLEHIAMCRMVMGNKTQALQEISTAVNLCRQHPRLLETHGPQLHTLLGLYSMSMNCMEAAEAQFKAALNVVCDLNGLLNTDFTVILVSEFARERIMDFCKFKFGYCLSER